MLSIKKGKNREQERWKNKHRHDGILYVATERESLSSIYIYIYMMIIYTLLLFIYSSSSSSIQYKSSINQPTLTSSRKSWNNWCYSTIRTWLQWHHLLPHQPIPQRSTRTKKQHRCDRPWRKSTCCRLCHEYRSLGLNKFACILENTILAV